MLKTTQLRPETLKILTTIEPLAFLHISEATLTMAPQAITTTQLPGTLKIEMSILILSISKTELLPFPENLQKEDYP